MDSLVPIAFFSSRADAQNTLAPLKLYFSSLRILVSKVAALEQRKVFIAKQLKAMQTDNRPVLLVGEEVGFGLAVQVPILVWMPLV